MPQTDLLIKLEKQYTISRHYKSIVIQHVIQTMYIRPSCRSMEGRIHWAAFGDDLMRLVNKLTREY